MAINKIILIQEEILDGEKVAELLGSSKKVIEKKLRAGEIKGSKRLNRWYVLKSDLIQYIEDGKVDQDDSEDEE